MKRVLVFNFFDGVMDRGIPVYTNDLAECMRRVEIEPVQLRCPSWLRGRHRILRNAGFVFFEQVVAPIMRVLRNCSLTVYPYNSVGIIDSVLGRSVLVVHDLIPNRSLNLAGRYICLTQLAHCMLGRPVCAASAHTLRQLRRLAAFKRCSLQLWSNPFYSFQAGLTWLAGSVPRRREGPWRVLLCSGLSRHKDYGGALRLFAHSRALAAAELRILGFGDDSPLAARRLKRLPDSVSKRITILPRLSIDEVVAEYVASDLVWVHSQREGFGRCIVEGRLAGRPVVASDISAFRDLDHPGVHLYDAESFDPIIADAIAADSSACVNTVTYHAPLEASVSQVVALHGRIG